MEQSEKARQFLASLDQDQLQVGDGSNHLPVWIGIDAEAGRVYRIYAGGLVRGFGDGRMIIRSGLMAGKGWVSNQIEQSTYGRDVMLGDGRRLQCLECDPHPPVKSSTEKDALNHHGGPAALAITT